MKKILRGTFIALIIALVVMQFIQPDRTNPKYDSSQDFLTVNAVDSEIGHFIKTACYDCHSNETKWPWYSKVAPMSYAVAHHVEEGREHLNFSEWGTYSEGKADHKLEECIEEIKEGEMPLWGYTALHADADLTDEQLEQLVNFFDGLR